MGIRKAGSFDCQDVWQASCILDRENRPTRTTSSFSSSDHHPKLLNRVPSRRGRYVGLDRCCANREFSPVAALGPRHIHPIANPSPKLEETLWRYATLVMSPGQHSAQCSSRVIGMASGYCLGRDSSRLIQHRRPFEVRSPPNLAEPPAPISILLTVQFKVPFARTSARSSHDQTSNRWKF